MFTDLVDMIDHKKYYCKLRFTCKCDMTQDGVDCINGAQCGGAGGGGGLGEGEERSDTEGENVTSCFCSVSAATDGLEGRIIKKKLSSCNAALQSASAI